MKRMYTYCILLAAASLTLYAPLSAAPNPHKPSYSESGSSGNPHLPRLHGRQGRLGQTGPQGVAGRCGPCGTCGLDGPRGAPGRCGPPGNRGTRGPKGERGERGKRGHRGERGERGHFKKVDGTIHIHYTTKNSVIGTGTVTGTWQLVVIAPDGKQFRGPVVNAADSPTTLSVKVPSHLIEGLYTISISGRNLSYSNPASMFMPIDPAASSITDSIHKTHTASFEESNPLLTPTVNLAQTFYTIFK